MKCLSPHVKINKMVNEHTVEYHRSPLGLTSRIHSLIFLWTPKGFIFSPEYFLNFFSNLYIAPWLRKSFKFMVLRLLETLSVKKLNLFIFPYVPKQKSFLGSYHYPCRHEEIIHFPQTTFFVFFLSRKGGGLWSWKKWPKLNLQGHWLQVFIIPTIFATFTFLVFVLLHYNLNSSILKCEGYLT